MAAPATEPRDLQPEREPESARPSGTQPHLVPGRWEREGKESRQVDSDSTTARTSRTLFFVMMGIIAAAIALFLILHPQPGD